MTTAFVIKSVIEAMSVILLIVGFVYEEKVIEFERTLFRAISIYFKLRRQRRAKRRFAQSTRPAVRLRALMALPSTTDSDTTRAA